MPGHISLSANERGSKFLRNTHIEILRRQTLFQKKDNEIGAAARNSTDEFCTAELFAEEEVKDDQLRMIFACCHPILPRESQIGLTLKTLCGFGVAEISRSFLSKEETIAKRLTRARQTLRNAGVPFEIPASEELSRRLDSVLQVLYLLFNEGYNASHGPELIRWDLSAEALRLLYDSVLAEFQIERSQFREAAEHLTRALDLTTLESEQTFLRNKLKLCEAHFAV